MNNQLTRKDIEQCHIIALARNTICEWLLDEKVYI